MKVARVHVDEVLYLRETALRIPLAVLASKVTGKVTAGTRVEHDKPQTVTRSHTRQADIIKRVF